MKKKILIFILSLLILFGIIDGVKAQMSLDSLIGKIGQISIEGKSTVDILNAITQEGELDSSVPKRTIIKEAGQIETVFVFDFGETHQKTFEDFQNYFLKKEGFQTQNQKEEGEIKASELQKGTTKILLAKKGNIVVEDRLEGFLSVATPPKTEAEEPVTAKWTQIIIGIVIIIAIAVCGFVAKRFLQKKSKSEK